MSEKTLADDVRGFYEGESLAEERVNAILDVSTHVASARRWKQAAVAASIALAAMTLLAVGLFLRQHNDQTADRSIADNPASSAATPGAGGIEARSPAVNDRDHEYRLVAFRSHGDECPHCRATGEVVEQLTIELADQPIAIEQFDLSQNSDRPTIDNRLADLKLTALIEGRIETAFLALVNNDGMRIKEFKPSMKSDRIVAAIREVVME